jgi:hypothetical protein
MVVRRDFKNCSTKVLELVKGLDETTVVVLWYGGL